MVGVLTAWALGYPILVKAFPLMQAPQAKAGKAEGHQSYPGTDSSGSTEAFRYKGFAKCALTLCQDALHVLELNDAAANA